jgi:sulfonate transport system ATP-binding protein
MTSSSAASGAVGTPALLRVDNVSHRYGGADATSRSPLALRDISLTVEPGVFMSIVGPSGCGKSTLLKLIAGLERPASGTVEVAGTAVRGVRRDVGFVFQSDALLPWKSLRENVALALRYRKVPRQEALERAQHWLHRVGLGNLGDRYPHQVSGGQRKRASICATMVYEPPLMLMDEPFGALDVQTRDLIETDILAVWSELASQSVVFVTHDLEEAIALSDRVIVLSSGPGHIVSDYHVDLPRPREVREVRSEPAFREIYDSLWADLRAEVMTAHARASGDAAALSGRGARR